VDPRERERRGGRGREGRDDGHPIFEKWLPPEQKCINPFSLTFFLIVAK